MDEQGGRKCKYEKVDHYVWTGKVQRAVGLVLAEVELVACRIEDPCGIVRVAEEVGRVSSTDMHIGEVPSLSCGPSIRTSAHGRGQNGEKGEKAYIDVIEGQNYNPL